MITTLFGSNAFGLHRELDSLVAAFLAEHDSFGLEQLDGAEAPFTRIQEALTSPPFLASKKLIVLREASANKQFTEKAADLLAETPETTDVILVETKLDKRLGFYKYLKSKTNFTEFNELDAGALASWLVIAAHERGGSLSSGDARYLVERVGANQQLVSNELDKLLLYESKISRATIELLTEASPQSTIFQLLEAAFAGRAKRALELYAEQRALKVEPQQIVAMLAWQLHVLAIIKSAGSRSADDIAKAAKLNPFVVRKSQTIARSLTAGQLKSLISRLLTIDIQSKRTIIDLDEALEQYLLTLSV